MSDMSQYIWIDEAANEYRRSRSYMRNLVRAKALKGYRFPGDRRLYLSRDEVARFFAQPPHVVNEAE